MPIRCDLYTGQPWALRALTAFYWVISLPRFFLSETYTETSKLHVSSGAHLNLSVWRVGVKRRRDRNGAEREELLRNFEGSVGGFSGVWKRGWLQKEQPGAEAQERIRSDDVHGNAEGLWVLRGVTGDDEISDEAQGWSWSGGHCLHRRPSPLGPSSVSKS